MSDRNNLSRRGFLKTSLAATIVAGFPTIVPSRVLGAEAPSNIIQLAQIGCGRIAHSMDMKGVTGDPKTAARIAKLARYIAVCDLDSKRAASGKAYIEKNYANTLGGDYKSEIKAYGDYREMLQDKSIDAVLVSTPDHWHAQCVIESALAGKDVYSQKPLSLTIREGRQMADTIKKMKRVYQCGSQLRSMPHFQLAIDLVRAGVIGKIKEVKLGVTCDPAGGNTAEMPVPPNLNYDMWLGSTPQVYYTEERVHPQNSISARPGWLRCEQFGAGMITGWGAHDIDVAQWGMGLDLSGPLEIEARGEFPKKGSGLWDVHTTLDMRALYAGGIVLTYDDKTPSSVKFIGEEGWILVSRGSYNATASDPKSKAANLKALSASDPKILDYKFKDGDKRSHVSPENDHHLDYITAVRTRGETAAPIDKAHRGCSTCLLAHISMKLGGRKLQWDPEKEQFVGDEEANKMLARPQRAPYGTDAVLAKA